MATSSRTPHAVPMAAKSREMYPSVGIRSLRRKNLLAMQDVSVDLIVTLS